MVRVQDLLKDPSLFAPDGSQLRPIARSDIDEALLALYVFTRNGMQPAVLQFDGLCLMGSDLRGLNPSGDGPFQVSFVNSTVPPRGLPKTTSCWTYGSHPKILNSWRDCIPDATVEDLTYLAFNECA